MSRVLQLEMSDAQFRALSQQAASESVQPETVAIRVLEANLQAAASERNHEGTSAFRRMFGVADLGQATGLDNVAIDADLAKEYARGLDD